MNILNIDKIISSIGEDYKVTDEEYFAWKQWYDQQEDHEKVFHLLGALSQYLTSPDSHAAAGVLAMAVVCTERWTSDKSDQQFLEAM